MGFYIPVEHGVKLFVEDLDPGEGKPVVFLHGWPVNHKMFEYQFDVLPQLGFRCIGLDLRGFGRSDRPWDGYGYDRLADDLRIVVDALGLTEFALVGFSVGGAIAIRYMARHAGHGVTKLALLGAAAPVFAQRSDFALGLPVYEVKRLIEQTYTDRPKMLEGVGELFFARAVTQRLSDWFHGLGLEAAGHATVAVLRSLWAEDLRGDLAAIRVPTLICHGVQDRICPFPLAEALQAGIEGSTLVPFPFSGHGLFYCEGDTLNRELARFLA